MALNVRQTLYDQLWTLMLVREYVTANVKPQNRINTDADNWAHVEASRSAPNDFPYIAIVSTGGTWTKPPVTFGDGTEVDYEVPGTETLDIKIVADQLDNEHLMSLETEVMAGLATAGDMLGLPWVAWFSTRTSRATRRTAGGGALRSTSTLSLTVECRPWRSEVAAQ